MFTAEDAREFMIEQIASEDRSGGNPVLHSGSTVLIGSILQRYVRREVKNLAGSEIPDHYPKYERQFLDAAHELMRRGIFRLGPLGYVSQHRSNGLHPSSDNLYVLTEYGKAWIEAWKSQCVPPMDVGRYPQLISEYAKEFGPGFQQRATEAIKCYHAQAYLACCAMVGAASESILLHVAIAKAGKQKEEEVLREYGNSGGAGKIKNQVLQQRSAEERLHFEGIYELMKRWRDDTAHGKESSLSELEAYMSLYLLIRHAAYVRDNLSTYAQA